MDVLRLQMKKGNVDSFIIAGLLPTVIIAFHKPYGVLSQFTIEIEGQRTLAGFSFPKNVYPLGRLDRDSEGLLLLSDEDGLNDRLLDPRNRHTRTYWAQVENVPSHESLLKLEEGVMIEGRKSLPCRAWIIDPQPQLQERMPPIRFRKSIPTCWIALELIEGKNRQVRKMTSSIGHPTLRLIRIKIGGFQLGNLKEGEWKVLDKEERERVFLR